MITLFTLLLVGLTCSLTYRLIGWGIRLWFLIIGSMFFMIYGLSYYLLPLLIIVLIASLLMKRC